MRSVSFTSKMGDIRRKRPILDVVAPHRSSVPEAAYRPPCAVPVRPAFSSRKALDGVRMSRRTFIMQLQERSWQDSAKRAWRKTELYFRRVRRLLMRLVPDIAPRKMLYGSLVGGIAFGMVSMAFMEHFFGPGVFARSAQPEAAQVETITAPDRRGEAIVSRSPSEAAAYNSDDDIFFEYFSEAEKEQYEADIREMVKGYPIEEMLPYIFEQDRLTAAFLIGIAKKESNWGKRIPVLNGQDCFNYWGYRGIRRMMGTGGHTCFNSQKDAVDTVAKRLKTLVAQNLDTPEKMIVWKCGFSCKGHSRESVKKWISDVDMYFKQLNNGYNE